MNFWILRQIPFQSQRHGASLQFHLWPINAGQGNQMLPVPAAAILFDQGGIGKQINGTFKKMDGAAPRCGDAERVPFVAATGISHKVCPYASQVCVPGLAIPIQPHENRIVVGKAFIQPPGANAEINEFRINATATQVGINPACIRTGPWQQQHLWFYQFRRCLPGQIGCLPGDPLHGFRKGQLSDLDKIIQRIVAAKATGKPVPFPIGDFEGIMLPCAVMLAADVNQFVGFAGSQVCQ